MAKSGLGKGLGALLNDSQYDGSVLKAPGTAGTQEAKPAEQFVDIELLKPNPHQPRTEFDDQALAELADSIREHGVIQPVLAEEAADGTYYIIAGERRTRAAKLAGLTKVPVYLKSYSDETRLEVALIENIQRENLNAVEEARAYQKLMQLRGLSQDEAAKRVGKNRSTVANALRLLKLPEDMLGAITSGELTAGHARALLSVTNPADQRVLFARIIGTQMSVREAETQAAELNAGGRATAKKKEAAPKPKNPDLAALEQRFIDALGTKVNIKGGPGRGSLQIDYYSADDLERLYEKLVK